MSPAKIQEMLVSIWLLYRGETKLKFAVIPSICVPKSSFITSSYWSTVLSPEFGVQWAATLEVKKHQRWTWVLKKNSELWIGRESWNQPIQRASCRESNTSFQTILWYKFTNNILKCLAYISHQHSRLHYASYIFSNLKIYEEKY